MYDAMQYEHTSSFSNALFIVGFDCVLFSSECEKESIFQISFKFHVVKVFSKATAAKRLVLVFS